MSQPVTAKQPGSQQWEREIRAFEAADRANPPPQGEILFVGSSTIRKWTTLAQDFSEYKVLNRGFGGCRIADCTYYADRIVVPYKPRLIVLRAGGNDIHAGKTPEQVRADFQAFVEKVRAKLPEVRIAYMTINATPARWANVTREKKANQLIKGYIAKGENLDYIDTFDATMGADGKPREELFVKDRLHFNAESYKILTSLVRKHLMKRPAEDRLQRPTSADGDFLPRLVPIPVDRVLERRAHAQPTVPAGAKEIPYVERMPEPALTDAEKQRGYVLFARPTVEPIYPNTRPRPDERLEALVAFAAPGQFEPVTLALYPVRPLVNLKVRVSSLACSTGEIPADRIDVRLGTYWNVGYPSYTTIKTYRRTPELLERVTVHGSPAGECQRYWLTIHVPDDARPGLYLGTVTVWDEGFDRALSIPIALRVLGFRLQKDPAKHCSAYFYTRNKSLYQGRSEAFVRKAADNDYRAMADFGLDMLPTLYLSCEDGKRIAVRDADEIPRMLRAGLRGPAPVTADDVIRRVYRDTTPGGKIESHWRVSPLPPPDVLRPHYRAVPGVGGRAEGQGLAGVHLLPD